MENLTKTIGVRLTEAEYNLLDRSAKEQHRKVADYVREIIRKSMKN